jgi:hypothetical protein
VEFTQTIKLGGNIEARIRLQETIAPGKKNELGIDLRKFLNNYPLKGGRQGILIAANKWIPFFMKEVLFTMSIAQPEDWVKLVEWINKISIEKYPEAFYQESASQASKMVAKNEIAQEDSRQAPTRPTRVMKV